MKKFSTLAVVITLTLVSAFAGAQAILLQDDFTGTTIDTGKWEVVETEANGTITQDGQLIFNSTSVNGAVYGSQYVISNLVFTRPTAPLTHRYQFDMLVDAPASGNTVAAVIGFHKGSTYSSYANIEYFDAMTNSTANTFAESWYDPGYPAGGFATGVYDGTYVTVRVTLAPGSDPGMVCEVNPNDGTGWQGVANTLATSVWTPVENTYRFVMDIYAYAAMELRIDNIIIEEVDYTAVDDWRLY